MPRSVLLGLLLIAGVAQAKPDVRPIGVAKVPHHPVHVKAEKHPDTAPDVLIPWHYAPRHVRTIAERYYDDEGHVYTRRDVGRFLAANDASQDSYLDFRRHQRNANLWSTLGMLFLPVQTAALEAGIESTKAGDAMADALLGYNLNPATADAE